MIGAKPPLLAAILGALKANETRQPIAPLAPAGLFRQIKDQRITEPGEVRAQLDRGASTNKEQRRVVSRIGATHIRLRGAFCPRLPDPWFANE